MLKTFLVHLSQKIKGEMKDLCSDEHASVLRDITEAVTHFQWETVMLEFEKKLPTLVTLLEQIVPQPAEHRPLLALLISQLVKARHQKTGLVQRAISVMLYGNCSNKQVGALTY